MLDKPKELKRQRQNIRNPVPDGEMTLLPTGTCDEYRENDYVDGMRDPVGDPRVSVVMSSEKPICPWKLVSIPVLKY